MLLVARAREVLSSGDDQEQNASKNGKWLSQRSAPLCVCTFKGGTLLTNLNFQMMVGITFFSLLCSYFIISLTFMYFLSFV